MAQPPAMRIHSQHCLTPQSKRKNCDLAFKYIYPTFLTEPKKSVIGTRLGSLLQEKVSKIGKKQVKVFSTWTNQSWCPQLICKLSWDKLSGTLPSSSWSSALPSRGTQVHNMCTWNIILDKVFLLSRAPVNDVNPNSRVNVVGQRIFSHKTASHG